MKGGENFVLKLNLQALKQKINTEIWKTLRNGTRSQLRSS